MFSSVIDIVIFFPWSPRFLIILSFEIFRIWNRYYWLKYPRKAYCLLLFFHSSLLERKEEESIWHPGTSVITLSCIFYKHGNKLSIAHRLGDSSQCQSHQNHQFLSVDCLFRNYTLYGRSYGRKSKFFRLDGLLLPFCIIMGLRSASSAITRDVSSV